MIAQNGKLEIFEFFFADPHLPKHRKNLKGVHFEFDGVRKLSAHVEEQIEARSGLVHMPGVGQMLSSNPNFPRRPSSRKGWLGQFLDFFIGRKEENDNGRQEASDAIPSPEDAMTVLNFFVSLKNSAEEIKIVEKRAKGYEKAIQDADKTGQIALREHLIAGMEAARSEAQLVSLGLSKFLAEETILRFAKDCPKGLRLDWIANFGRVIPDKIIKTKERLDSLMVFDNYAVLHYDPLKKAIVETKEQEQARKDPILFGLMTGRRRLYIVGDWVDEYCDLTVDAIADLLGEDVVKDIDGDSDSYRENGLVGTCAIAWPTGAKHIWCRMRFSALDTRLASPGFSSASYSESLTRFSLEKCNVQPTRARWRCRRTCWPISPRSTVIKSAHTNSSKRPSRTRARPKV